MVPDIIASVGQLIQHDSMRLIKLVDIAAGRNVGISPPLKTGRQFGTGNCGNLIRNGNQSLLAPGGIHKIGVPVNEIVAVEAVLHGLLPDVNVLVLRIIIQHDPDEIRIPVGPSVRIE